MSYRLWRGRCLLRRRSPALWKLHLLLLQVRMLSFTNKQEQYRSIFDEKYTECPGKNWSPWLVITTANLTKQRVFAAFVLNFTGIHRVRTAIVKFNVVCLSVCLSQANFSETKRDRRMVTRKLKLETGLPDSASAIRFTIATTVPPSWVFLGWQFAHSDRNGTVGSVNGSVGTVTSPDTRPALPVPSCASSNAQLHRKKSRTQKLVRHRRKSSRTSCREVCSFYDNSSMGWRVTFCEHSVAGNNRFIFLWFTSVRLNSDTRLIFSTFSIQVWQKYSSVTLVLAIYTLCIKKPDPCNLCGITLSNQAGYG